jgi:hypothetical protein
MDHHPTMKEIEDAETRDYIRRLNELGAFDAAVARVGSAVADNRDPCPKDIGSAIVFLAKKLSREHGEI